MNYSVSSAEASSIPAALHGFSDRHFGRPDAVADLSIPLNIGPERHARHIEQIMDTVPQHMFMLEPDGRLSFVNCAGREYLGPIDAISPTERLHTITHPDDFDSLAATYRDALMHGVAVEAEARVRSKNGEYRWFTHQLFPLRDEFNRIVRWYGTRVDIEDRKRAKDEARQETLALPEELDSKSMFEEILGGSAKLQAVLVRVARVAKAQSTVLITGETGTGKELIARAIHKRSDRAHRPFISVNCAAIPRDLIASELFGHEKGAFTGALQRRIGRFEQAEGGTLFLDEIGELPAETQVALLRVLQEREFQRLGGSQTIRANVRVIAATHRDLPKAIAAGTFRSDLFYRINVFPLEVPALRERKEDIPLLVKYFIHRYCAKTGREIKRIDRKSLECLQAYSWPGNIRELQNIIERSVILCDAESFSVDQSWLGHRIRPARPLSHEMMAQETELIEAALAESKGRVSGRSGAATKLGMPPSTLDSKIRALKIDKRRFYAN